MSQPPWFTNSTIFINKIWWNLSDSNFTIQLIFTKFSGLRPRNWLSPSPNLWTCSPPDDRPDHSLEHARTTGSTNRDSRSVRSAAAHQPHVSHSTPLPPPGTPAPRRTQALLAGGAPRVSGGHARPSRPLPPGNFAVNHPHYRVPTKKVLS
jgi:hypothetical protein